MFEYVSEDQTVNEKFYREFPIKLRKLGKKDCICEIATDGYHHQNNEPVTNALSVKPIFGEQA